MLCYKDMTFCSILNCNKLDCKRNQLSINQEHLNKVGSPIAQSDYFYNCEFYQPISNCCGADIIEYYEICSECHDHCEIVNGFDEED